MHEMLICLTLYMPFSDDDLSTNSYSVVGVSIAPGFDYNDMKTAPYGCILEL